MNNSRTGKNTIEKFQYSDWAKNSASIPHLSITTMIIGIYRAISDIVGGVLDYSVTENVVNNEFQVRVRKIWAGLKIS